jgi:hypothetical protein
MASFQPSEPRFPFGEFSCVSHFVPDSLPTGKVLMLDWSVSRELSSSSQASTYIRTDAQRWWRSVVSSFAHRTTAHTCRLGRLLYMGGEDRRSLSHFVRQQQAVLRSRTGGCPWISVSWGKVSLVETARAIKVGSLYRVGSDKTSEWYPQVWPRIPVRDSEKQIGTSSCLKYVSE